MITITRRQARRLRAVFRRHPLGVAHNGLVAPLVLRADPVVGLRIRHHQAALAVEHVLPGAYGPGQAVALPLDALADFEGKDDAPVVLEAAGPGRTIVRWADRGVPQSKEYAVPDPDGLPPFPGSPAVFESCPADLLGALAEAAATTDGGSTRYALDCVQMRGDAGELVATDGRQVLVQGGFRFPWAGDVLVRPAPLFASRALPRDRPVGVGRTDAHVVLRAGDWTVWLTVRPDARFPRIGNAIPDASAAATRLRLDPEDAAFLGRAIDRLPGGDETNGPATLDLNGRVAVRAHGSDPSKSTELVLAGSAYTGAPVRVVANRGFLARAVRLGFTEFEFADAESPVAARDGRRVFCFQPLSAGSAVGPSDDDVRVESTPSTTRPAAGPVADHQGESTVREKIVPAAPTKGDGATGEGPGSGGLAELIREAEGLHGALSDARARAGRLTAALRRHRRRERLVNSTLASLRAIRLQDVAG